LSFSIGQATRDKLHRAQALLSHKIPDGDLATVLDRVLDLAIERLEKKKFGASSNHPARNRSSNPRHIPGHVRQTVWQRDGGQCTFVGKKGHRCNEARLVEFDHAVPVAHGGESTVENIRLRCRTHNQHEADRTFGSEFMRRKRQEAAAAKAELRRRHAKERAQEVIPYLRKLGYRADQAREAAVWCETIPDAPLQERVKLALSYLAPRGVTYRPIAPPPA